MGSLRSILFAQGAALAAFGSMLPSTIVLVMLVMIPSHSAIAQFRLDAPRTVSAGIDSLGLDLDAAAEPGAGEKLLWLSGAAITYSLFDYVGYNLARGDNGSLRAYRVLQVLVQAGITWLLHEQAGLPTAIAFNVIWWTWGMDALYYVYTDMFNAQGDWEKRGSFERVILGNRCTWASWTPIGIACGMDESKPIAGDALMAQVFAGAITAFTITITF